MTTFPYDTPRAFEAALTARFKTASNHSVFIAVQLHRQFAYDRLLARCFTASDAGRWILKGGISMLARLGMARHSADVDLAVTSTTLSASLIALTDTVAIDLGDFFTFDLAEPKKLVQGVEGIRIPVVARLGPRRYESLSHRSGHRRNHDRRSRNSSGNCRSRDARIDSP